jgi:DNA-binding NtrC family response regulator
MAGDIRLSRRQKTWDLVMRMMLAAPLRCRDCGERFYKRVSPTQLRSQPVRPVLTAAKPQPPAVLVVDDFNPSSKLIGEALASRGFAVFGTRSADEGLALFQAHKPEIELAVIDLVSPAAGNLDLAAELERLRPGLPVLYLVGSGKSIARCSIEAQAPGSVLVVPFTEDQFIARVGGLLDVQAAPRQMPRERLWERLVAGSGRMQLTTRPN